MKKYSFLIMLMGMVVIMATMAMKPVQQEWALGSTTAVTIVSDNDTADITPVKSLTLYTLATDTNNFVVNATGFAVPGAQMVFVVTASDTTAVKFDTGINSATITVLEGKTKTISFISNGSAWFNTGSVQVD